MRVHPRHVLRRGFTLTAASALAVAFGAAPAAAAVGAPTGLKTADQACVAEAPGPYLSPGRLNDARAVVLVGAVTGAAAGAELRADFQVWDVADPEHRQQWLRDVREQNDRVYVQLEDDARQLDGVTYAWRVRVLDGAAASPWSETCHFTIDRTGGDAPAVASTDYPAGDWEHAHGAIGVPGVFTVAPGAADVVGYRYRFYSSQGESDSEWRSVEPDRPGAPAAIRWTPAGAGHHSLTVYGVDRAGNWSDETHHVFYVTETRPSIFSAAYPEWGPNLDYNVGVPGAFELTSNVADTASFGWRIDGGPSGSVPADSAGNATAMIAPARAGRQTLRVWSVTRDGTAHAARAYEFLADNGPRLTGDIDRGVTIGSSLRFHLAPRMPAVESYVYWIEYYDSDRPIKKITIPARPDGTAELTWTATETGVAGIRFQSRSADGTLSEQRRNHISVGGAEPWITRSGGDDLGTPATFTARTEMADVVQYVAMLNRDEATKILVKPAADGSATFRYTAPRRGLNYVTVVARNAAGVQSTQGSTGSSWSVSDAPRVASTDFPEHGSGRLAPGTFTFTPRLPGTTSYEYSVNYGEDKVLQARPDGTATLAFEPTQVRRYRLEVRSRTADGTRSLATDYSFEVVRGTVTVTSVEPRSVAGGGIRMVTIRGAELHQRDTVQVTPAGGAPLTATVRTVSADRTAMTAEVDLTSAPTGPAAVTVRPYGDDLEPVVLADALTVTDPAPSALRATKRPAIVGTAVVGATVRAAVGTWTPDATGYAYRWAADGVLIKGATGAAYRVGAAVVGRRLTVTVTASRSGSPSGAAVSAASARVARAKPAKAVKKPRVTGTARVGRTVRAAVGAWSPTVDSYRYEWRVNGKVVRAATRSSLKLTPSMRNKRVTVTVVARKAGHADGRATSTSVTVRR